MRRPPLRWGVLLYLSTALADIWMTLKGMEGELMMEGNPIMRAMMSWLGPELGICLNKSLVFLFCVLLAITLEPEIKRRASWIEKIPMTPWSRAWMRSKDRSWISYIPLYMAGISQGLAALSWLLLPQLL